ncbi:hypothetical protein ACFE04_002397 [Oxalis oulophora]
MAFPPPPQPQPSSSGTIQSTPITIIGPQYSLPYPVDLACTRKVLTLTNRGFLVTDVNDTVIFKVKEKFFSFRDKRTLFDAAGNPVVTVTEKVFFMNGRHFVYRGASTDEKDLICTVKQSKLFQWKTTLNVFLANNTKRSVPDFKVKQSWSGRSCVIYAGESNNILAQKAEESEDKEDIKFMPSKESRGDTTEEALFGTMEKTLHLLEMDFSGSEISLAIDNFGSRNISREDIRNGKKPRQEFVDNKPGGFTDFDLHVHSKSLKPEIAGDSMSFLDSTTWLEEENDEDEDKHLDPRLPQSQVPKFIRSNPSAGKLPYFFYGSVVNLNSKSWMKISNFLRGGKPEFINARFFSALRRKEGYVHNLPTEFMNARFVPRHL